MRLGRKAWVVCILWTGLANAEDKIDFARDVQPILRARCVGCHGAAAQLSGSRLDRKQDALRGGSSGLVLQAGSSASSRLYKLVSSGIVVQGKTLRMPPGGQLPSNEAEIIRRWIDDGAVWPIESDNREADNRLTSNTRHRPRSFEPIRLHDVPAAP